MSELTVAIRQVIAARHPEDLFAVDSDAPAGEQAEQLKRSFRRLVRTVHPDANGNAAGAAAAFVKLERLYAQAQAALGTGVYGERGPTPEVVRGSRRTYLVGQKVGATDGADLVDLFADGRSYRMKVARSSADNDLIEREAQALAQLTDDSAAEARLRPYVCELSDSFTVPSPTGAGPLAANVFPRYDDFVSLADVRKAFPDGIHWRDMAWMFRRLLVAAGFAHANGIVHGAVLPDRVLIHPTDHGLILCDWAYHAPAGEPLQAIPSRYKRWYPPQVFAKEPADASLDILLAVRCGQYLLGATAPHWLLEDTIPPKLRAFLAGCATASPQTRPDDAWELLEEFDDLIGPREYRPFQMPLHDPETPSSGGPTAAQTDERG